MSNRYWSKGSSIAMCELTEKECIYPYTYCSVCPIYNPDGTDEKAQYWNDKRKPELEEKRKFALKTLHRKSD